jgi:hypothetical protein
MRLLLPVGVPCGCWRNQIDALDGGETVLRPVVDLDDSLIEREVVESCRTERLLKAS